MTSNVPAITSATPATRPVPIPTCCKPNQPNRSATTETTNCAATSSAITPPAPSGRIVNQRHRHHRRATDPPDRVLEPEVVQACEPAGMAEHDQQQTEDRHRDQRADERRAEVADVL